MSRGEIASVGYRKPRAKPVYVEVSVWFDEPTAEIKLAVTGFKDASATISNKRNSAHGHPQLYRQLTRVLREAEAPCPELLGRERSK